MSIQDGVKEIEKIAGKGNVRAFTDCRFCNTPNSVEVTHAPCESGLCKRCEQPMHTAPMLVRLLDSPYPPCAFKEFVGKIYPVNSFTPRYSTKELIVHVRDHNGSVWTISPGDFEIVQGALPDREIVFTLVKRSDQKNPRPFYIVKDKDPMKSLLGG